ncbi:retrotransposon protein, putative, ty1-copia subclass [Tanacetum coccineum]
MDNSKRGHIPMQERLDLNKTQGASTPKEVKRMQNVPYASAIGYIIQFQQNPGELHWTVVKNILKYLRNTKDMFLVYGGNPEAELRVDCYCDVGFETDRDDTKSQTGYVFILNGGAVDWKSSKQSTTVMSATEAEYIATLEATVEAVWIRKFILGLGARHYHRRYHYVRESIALGKIRFLKVHTDDNLADPFTKALPKGKLTQHARSMGLLKLFASGKFFMDLDFHLDNDVINSVVISRKFMESVNIDNNYHDLDIGSLMASNCNCGKDDLLEYVKINMGQYFDIESLFYRVPGKPENFASDCSFKTLSKDTLVWRRNLRSGHEMDQLDTLMGLLQHHCSSPIDDRQDFTLHHSNMYSVSVMRKYIDSRSLLTKGNKTRWNKLVPIKISILAWCLINDRLPTRSKLDSHGIDLHSLLCPVCDENIESAQHLFAHCNLACDLWSLVFKWWKLDNVPNMLMDLMTWVDSTNL